MPRKLLLRDGRAVDDEWTYLPAADGPMHETASSGAAAAAPAGSVILTLDRWMNDKSSWCAPQRPPWIVRLGVALSPADKVEMLAPDVARFELIAALFPGPSDGRGYTQGRLLRERYGFGGELRAAGYVRRDQLFFLARCGFDSFELPESEFGDAGRALATFSAEYQPSNDAGLAHQLPRRETLSGTGRFKPSPAVSSAPRR